MASIESFDEDKYFGDEADCYPPIECVFDGCSNDRVDADYPMCGLHARLVHYRYREDCRCVSCEARRVMLAEEFQLQEAA
jgi:hypothetical protein